MTRVFVFTARDIRKLAKAFGSKPTLDGPYTRFQVGVGERKLALEIYSGIRIGKRRGNLVSVYTRDSHLQLHFCSGYVVSDMLGEVTFVGEKDGKLSGLIVEKTGGCSLYANVDRSLLSGDFTHLGPEVMMSGIALSMTDTILEEGGRKKVRPRKRAKR
jgi:hypothetical protein